MADDSRRRLFGRRRGHGLSQVRLAGLEARLPAVKLDLACDPRSAFGRDIAGLWLEIGFGKGEHLVAQAIAHPQIGFIGCEPFLNGVVALTSEIAERGLTNIRVHDDDARLAIDALPDACLDRVFLLHPDPWPKTRHAERRFVGPANLDALARVMKDGAELRIGTDDPGYSAWTVMQMARHPAFSWPAETAADWAIRPADWPPTRYEAKARALGRAAVYLRYRRQPR